MIRSLGAVAGVFMIATVFADTGVPPVLPDVSASSTLAYQTMAIAPDVISAESYLVFDVATGEVLASHAPDTMRPIASITKLVTAAALLKDASALRKTIEITDKDVATPARAGRLEAGQEYVARELLFPLLLESSNDAAVALERATDTSLIARMNAEVKGVGMTFADSSGLSAENQASARGLAEYIQTAFPSAPHIFDITTLTQYVGSYHGWRNNNPVADLPGYRGGKHGYTDEAGRTIVAIFDEDISGSVRTLGYILLDSDDLRPDVELLREFVSTAVSYQ